MKTFPFSIIGFFCLCMAGYGQETNSHFILKPCGYIWTEGKFAGLEQADFAQKQTIQKLNDSLKTYLLPQLEKQFKNPSPPQFQIPVSDTAVSPGNTDFFTISAYVDHDPVFPNQVLDYNCGNLSYDLTDGYNHAGTDFFSWPFPWEKMNNNQVQAIAAAQGILYYKQDGNFDAHCELVNGDWNGCAILHPDGTTTWYIHLKKNSLTNKTVGQPIEAGEYLGIVGSSGNSVTPHLHFEVIPPEGTFIDPFEGECNPTTESSWWINQLPYKEKKIVRLSTNAQTPVLDDCPNPEVAYETDLFARNDTIFFVIYFKNVSLNDQLILNLRKPDNTVYASWTWTSPWEFYPASWLYFYSVLKNDDFGTWAIEVIYDETTYSHSFLYKESLSVREQATGHIRVNPNPATSFINISSLLKINKISIIDHSGIEKYQASIHNMAGTNEIIDIKHFESGLYIVRIYTDSDVYSQKILIMGEGR